MIPRTAPGGGPLAPAQLRRVVVVLDITYDAAHRDHPSEWDWSFEVHRPYPGEKQTRIRTVDVPDGREPAVYVDAIDPDEELPF